MARVTAEGYAEKQARNLKNSLPDVKSGIMNVTENPMEKAADAADKWALRIQESKGKWAANTRKVSLAEWQDAAANKGVDRIAAGIDAAHDKVVAFAEKLLPAVDAAKRKIEGMPSTTLDDNINRMTTYTREMAKFSNQ